MEDQNEILQEIKALHKKLDEIQAAIVELVGKKRAKADSKRRSAQSFQLTPEEVEKYKAQFSAFYTRWLANEETAVREELEALPVEELRRFADANNLNVTAKTSKEKVVRLIGFRFREKKQLTHSISRPPAANS